MSRLYFGTYSKNGAEGIYSVQNGVAALAARLKDASWLTAADGYLLAVSELTGNMGEAEGELVSYRIEAGGGLKEAGRMGTGGLAPCHIAYDSPGRQGVISNYMTGNIATFSLDGCGVPKRRQVIQLAHPGEAPGHAHCAVFTKGGDRFFVCDLGLDAAIERHMAGEIRRIGLPKGAGPRHAVLSNDEKTLYVVCELSCEVMAIDSLSGAIISRHGLSDEHHSGFAAAAAIRLHPSGRLLAASLRGNNKVTLFGLLANGGIGWRKDYPVPKPVPRDIAFSKDGARLFVALQDSAGVLVYDVSPKGGLVYREEIACPGVVSVCFA